MPTVALSLVRDRNGEVMVKYTGNGKALHYLFVFFTGSS